MCKHGTLTNIKLQTPNETGRDIIPVDSCIAEEIQELNNKGVNTLGCCCGHGKAGQIVEWENGFGKWKCHQDPPMALIREESVKLAKKLGYRPFKYYYADGETNSVWQMYLKTGCMTEEECEDFKINS